MSSPTRCPCLSGETYENCCGRHHRGEGAAPTAERLMRSRFSAFALQLADYLLETWHPDTRPPTLLLDPRQRWYRLDILRSDGGGLLDAGGTVEFRAYFRTDGPGGAAGVVHEESRFVRSAGRWVYLDGTDRR